MEETHRLALDAREEFGAELVDDGLADFEGEALAEVEEAVGENGEQRVGADGVAEGGEVALSDGAVDDFGGEPDEGGELGGADGGEDDEPVAFGGDGARVAEETADKSPLERAEMLVVFVVAGAVDEEVGRFWRRRFHRWEGGGGGRLRPTSKWSGESSSRASTSWRRATRR